jgi:hypothetical protein
MKIFTHIPGSIAILVIIILYGSQYRVEASTGIYHADQDVIRGRKTDHDLLRKALKSCRMNDYFRTVCSCVFDLKRGEISL